MSAPKKATPREELQRIEDALVDSILNASGDDLRDELSAAGLDPDACIADVEATIAATKAAHARNRLEGARAELAAWRRRLPQASVTALDAARARFERLKSGDPDLKQRIMLAARKGEGLSDSDLKALLEDLAMLEALEDRKEDE